MTHFSALKSLLAVSMAAGMLLTAASAAAQNTPGVLRVSAIPDEAPTELQRTFKPLGDYLAKATGLKVEFTPVTDYAASVEGLINHKLDMVWFGGFTFVQANDRSKGQVIPLVQRVEDEKFRSVFITTVPEQEMLCIYLLPYQHKRSNACKVPLLYLFPGWYPFAEQILRTRGNRISV